MVHSPRNAVVNMQLGTIPPWHSPNVLMEAASNMELPLFCKLIIDTCNDVHHMKPIGVINLKFYQIFFSFFFIAEANLLSLRSRRFPRTAASILVRR